MYRRISIATILVIAFSIQLTFCASSASATANVSFLTTDSTTKGNWPNSYGADGYYLANSVSSAPSYGSVTPEQQLNFTWAGSTSDPRALLVPGTSSGIASAWYSPAPFSVAINFTDSATHQVAIYFLDWDSGGRTENVQIVDASSGQL